MSYFRKTPGMTRKADTRIGHALERFSTRATHWAGSTWSFTTALAIVFVWIVTGPIFKWSDTWQLVINTGTTIVTFLMVFLIQRAQNKESQAIQLKLNEIVAAMDQASNRLVDVEDLSEKELETLHGRYRKLAKIAKGDASLKTSHSVEDAVKGKVEHEVGRELAEVHEAERKAVARHRRKHARANH